MKASEILKSNWLDIVFEYRNKKYGAYNLRNTYENHLKLALSVVLLSAVLIFSSFMLVPKEPVSDRGYATAVDFSEKPIFEQKVEPKKAVALPKTTKVKSREYTDVTVEPDSKVVTETKVADRTELTESDISKVTNTDGGNATNLITDGLVTTEGTVGSGEATKIEAPEKADMPLDIAEVNPSFVGGYAALMEFLAKNIHYPSYGIENGIEGRVIVQFVVDENGNIINPKVVRGMGGEFDANAIEAVRKMPKWNPGKQHGSAVKVRFTLPITFSLNRG